MKRMLLVALLAFAGIGTASAFTVNSISYKDDETFFKWTFKVTFGPDTDLFTINPVDPDGQLDWSLKLFSDDHDGDGKLNDIVIDGKHLHGPHTLDVDPGRPFQFLLPNIPDVSPVLNPEPVLPLHVDMQTVDHLHTPNNHQDIVDLFITDATKNGGVYIDATLVLQGVHVPEPMTAALLLAAVTGLALRRRLR